MSLPTASVERNQPVSAALGARSIGSGRRRRHIAWTAVLTGLLLSLCLAEAISYIYLRTVEGYDGRHLLPNQFDDYKHLQPVPGYVNTKGIAHNGQGFRRSTDVTKDKAPGVYRIFLMGGSTAYGLGSLSRHGRDRYGVIRNDETIDFYLEQFLKARLPERQVEVINAAITSHYSHHHLIYLNQTILKYRPDMVIFLDGYNDYFSYAEGFDQFRDYPYRAWSHLFLDEPTIKGYLAYTGWWLYQKSHLVYVTVKQLRPLWRSVTDTRQGREQIDVEQALHNLETNADNNFIKMVERSSLILRHEGVVSVVTLQPEIAYRQHKILTPFERILFDEVATSWPVNFMRFKNEARPLVTAKLSDATARTGAQFFDLTESFASLSEDAYSDHCHLTSAGNRALANDLAQRLLPLVEKTVARH